MITVHFTGWKKGIRSISFTKLLCHHTGLPLKEAKDLVDGLLAGKSFVIECATVEKATSLSRTAEQLGVISIICEEVT